MGFWNIVKGGIAGGMAGAMTGNPYAAAAGAGLGAGAAAMSGDAPAGGTSQLDPRVAQDIARRYGGMQAPLVNEGGLYGGMPTIQGQGRRRPLSNRPMAPIPRPPAGAGTFGASHSGAIYTPGTVDPTTRVIGGSAAQAPRGTLASLQARGASLMQRADQNLDLVNSARMPAKQQGPGAGVAGGQYRNTGIMPPSDISSSTSGGLQTGVQPQPLTGPAAFTGFRDTQAALTQQLQDQAAGRGPSIADLAMQSAGDRNARMQQSMAAGARVNPAAAMRMAQQGTGQFYADTAADAAAARLAEQRQAQGLLGQVAFQGRGGDINVSQGNQDALIRQQQLNQDAELRAAGLMANLTYGPNTGEQVGGALSNAAQAYLAYQKAQGAGAGGAAQYGLNPYGLPNQAPG